MGAGVVMTSAISSTPPPAPMVCSCGPVSRHAFSGWRLNGYFTTDDGQDAEMRTCRVCGCSLSIVSTTKRGDL